MNKFVLSLLAIASGITGLASHAEAKSPSQCIRDMTTAVNLCRNYNPALNRVVQLARRGDMPNDCKDVNGQTIYVFQTDIVEQNLSNPCDVDAYSLSFLGGDQPADVGGKSINKVSGGRMFIVSRMGRVIVVGRNGQVGELLNARGLPYAGVVDLKSFSADGITLFFANRQVLDLNWVQIESKLNRYNGLRTLLSGQF